MKLNTQAKIVLYGNKHFGVDSNYFLADTRTIQRYAETLGEGTEGTNGKRIWNCGDYTIRETQSRPLPLFDLLDKDGKVLCNHFWYEIVKVLLCVKELGISTEEI